MKSRYGILLPKLFWPTVRKNCSSDWEKNLKFEAEGREFSRLLEQSIQRVKGQNNSWQQNAGGFSDPKNRTVIIQIGKNYWDLEICRES